MTFAHESEVPEWLRRPEGEKWFKTCHGSPALAQLEPGFEQLQRMQTTCKQEAYWLKFESTCTQSYSSLRDSDSLWPWDHRILDFFFAVENIILLYNSISKKYNFSLIRKTANISNSPPRK